MDAYVSQWIDPKDGMAYGFCVINGQRVYVSNWILHTPEKVGAGTRLRHVVVDWRAEKGPKITSCVVESEKIDTSFYPENYSGRGETESLVAKVYTGQGRSTSVDLLGKTAWFHQNYSWEDGPCGWGKDTDFERTLAYLGLSVEDAQVCVELFRAGQRFENIQPPKFYAAFAAYAEGIDWAMTRDGRRFTNGEADTARIARAKAGMDGTGDRRWIGHWTWFLSVGAEIKETPAEVYRWAQQANGVSLGVRLTQTERDAFVAAAEAAQLLPNPSGTIAEEVTRIRLEAKRVAELVRADNATRGQWATLRVGDYGIATVAHMLKVANELEAFLNK